MGAMVLVVCGLLAVPSMRSVPAARPLAIGVAGGVADA